MGGITVFRVDHQSVEVRESDFSFLAIFSLRSFRFFYQRDYFVSEFPEFIPMVLQISSFSFSISPFAFSNISFDKCSYPGWIGRSNFYVFIWDA